MSLVTLTSLDRKTIAVSLDIDGRPVLVTGVGALYEDSALGLCLRIEIQDEMSCFDIVLRENEWNGEIYSGAASGCDYCISLSGECHPVGLKN